MAIQTSIGRSMVLRIAVVGILLTACAQPEPVNGGESADAGKVLFEQRCVECHGADGKAGVAGASDLSKSVLSDDKLEQVILKGRNAMPPFKLLIDSDSTLQQLVGHVKSLRKP